MVVVAVAPPTPEVRRVPSCLCTTTSSMCARHTAPPLLKPPDGRLLQLLMTCRTPRSMAVEDEHEAHIPAQHPSPEAQARLPGTDAHACRSCDCPATSCEGSQVSYCVGRSVQSLASSQRIRAVRAARQRAAAATMVVHVLERDLETDEDDHARVAIVAGRAVGNAVRRNRAKRRLRAAARQVRLPAIDVVVDARAAAIDVPFDVLPADLERLTTKARERTLR
jgi:ribonuclease P protein component